MLGQVPAWVIDVRNWAGLVSAILTAVGGFWRWVAKPALRKMAEERRREIAEQLAPFAQTMTAHSTALHRIEARLDRVADVQRAHSDRLERVEHEQRAMHTDLRTHMTDETRLAQIEAEIERNKGDGK